MVEPQVSFLWLLTFSVGHGAAHGHGPRGGTQSAAGRQQIGGHGARPGAAMGVHTGKAGQARELFLEVSLM